MTNNQTEQNQPPPPPRTQPGFFDPKPRRAALCAIIPGIGAVYNREYVKAVVHFSVFAGLTLIAEAVELFGLAAFSFSTGATGSGGVSTNSFGSVMSTPIQTS